MMKSRKYSTSSMRTGPTLSSTKNYKNITAWSTGSTLAKKEEARLPSPARIIITNTGWTQAIIVILVWGKHPTNTAIRISIIMSTPTNTTDSISRLHSLRTIISNLWWIILTPTSNRSSTLIPINNNNSSTLLITMEIWICQCFHLELSETKEVILHNTQGWIAVMVGNSKEEIITLLSKGTIPNSLRVLNKGDRCSTPSTFWQTRDDWWLTPFLLAVVREWVVVYISYMTIDKIDNQIIYKNIVINQMNVMLLKRFTPLWRTAYPAFSSI